jgi:hypothetical protein
LDWEDWNKSHVARISTKIFATPATRRVARRDAICARERREWKRGRKVRAEEREGGFTRLPRRPMFARIRPGWPAAKVKACSWSTMNRRCAAHADATSGLLDFRGGAPISPSRASALIDLEPHPGFTAPFRPARQESAIGECVVLGCDPRLRL